MDRPRVVYEKNFNKMLEQLMRSGKRNVVMKARAAMTEAATEGVIKGLERTHHGESRLPKAEKYNLGDGYRLVVQLIDGKTSVRAFLFVGNHDDAERWLDNHRGYRWVRTDREKTLVFTQASMALPLDPSPAIPDPAVPLSRLEAPLLADLSEEEWRSLGLPDPVRKMAATVTRSQWEQEDSLILENLEKAADYDTASLMFDVLTHAHRGEIAGLRQRILLHVGKAHVATESEAAEAMLDERNSETFITWNNEHLPPEDASWEEWMLFLQPEQREFARRDFNGPARLRGVSGSGKTCVAVHRARYLALKYKEPVLLVTLTHSMRSLLDRMIRSLCGAEQTLMQTRTINALATDVLEACHPKKVSWFTMASPERTREFKANLIKTLKHQQGFEGSTMSRMPPADLAAWLWEEVEYLRGRLIPDRFAEYENPQAFQRVGRVVRLLEKDRAAVLACARFLVDELTRLHLLDYLGVDAAAHGSLCSKKGTTLGYRCVIVDEVQDLTQVQLEIVARLPTPHGALVSEQPNGLFLVGDGAQAIYKRGFSFAASGISVANRSFALKQNYRNTREILEASYRLIEGYDFADVDEDNVTRPLLPELAARHGDKPALVKCATHAGATEWDFVVKEAKSHLECGVEPSHICIIGCASYVRDQVLSALTRARIPVAEIRDNSAASGRSLCLSTIESAKGHEFKVVFVCGVNDRVIPGVAGKERTDMAREAARLYVAMTRARDNLYMTYTSSSQDRPSRLLTTIQAQCDEFGFDGRELKAL